MSKILDFFKRNGTYRHVNSKGTEYWLHCKDVELRGGHIQTIYYLSRDLNPTYACKFPKGFKVLENYRNGFVTMVRTEAPK